MDSSPARLDITLRKEQLSARSAPLDISVKRLIISL